MKLERSNPLIFFINQNSRYLAFLGFLGISSERVLAVDPDQQSDLFLVLRLEKSENEGVDAVPCLPHNGKQLYPY
jgi:hypothetical protein